MKLLRYGPAGHEKPGAIDSDGVLRDLSMLLADLGAAQLAPRTLAALRAIDLSRLPAVDGSPRIGCPVAGIGKIIGVGLNYADHAREAGMSLPSEPVLFTKAVSSLCGPNDEIILPRDSGKCDWEVELGVVIGSRARYVEEADALDHVAGYVVVNDLSERAFQLERPGNQWDKGKGCDTFCPVGPWLVTRDEIAEPQTLPIWLELNGRRMQDSNTKQLVFGIAAIVAYISRHMTLEAGDLISTGTPPGVGLGQKPQPFFLKPGDRLRLGVEGLGVQEQLCREWTPADL